MNSSVLVLGTVLVLSTTPRIGAAQGEAMADQEDLRRTLAESAESETDTGADEDALADMVDAPLDLNAAREDQLVRLPGVTPRVARLILSHRRRHGEFTSVDSLRTVSGLSPDDIEMIRPFVFAGRNAANPRAVRLRLSYTMHRRLDPGKGFSRDPADSTKRYLGGPLAWTTRIFVGMPSFAANLSADHDRGEPWLWQPVEGRFGPDFISWSLEFRPGEVLRNLVIGDIRHASRMSLAAGTGSFASFERPSRSASHGPPRGYSGVRNSSRGRGVAVRIVAGPTEVTMIGSRRRRDARIDVSAAGDSILVLNSSDGNHRTEAELARRNLLSEGFLAIRIGVKQESLNAGVTVQRVAFDRAVSRVERPDQLYGFQGRSQFTVGIDLSWYSDRTRCAAEAITSAIKTTPSLKSLSTAGLCEISVGRSFRAWTYIRILSGSSASLAGAPLNRAGGRWIGERGVSFGVRSRPARGVVLTIYGDLWRHPWLRFNLWRPSAGRELGIRLARKRKRSNASVRITCSARETGVIHVDRIGRSIRSNERIGRTSISVTSSWWADPRIAVVTAAAVRLAQGPALSSARATMISVGARYRHRRLSLDAGVALFDSPAAATRIYAYEPAMRYGFGAISYSGVGERWYVLLSAAIAPAVLVQIKYTSSTRYGARSIGSGLDEVSGNRIRDFGFQVVINTEG